MNSVYASTWAGSSALGLFKSCVPGERTREVQELAAVLFVFGVESRVAHPLHAQQDLLDGDGGPPRLFLVEDAHYSTGVDGATASQRGSAEPKVRESRGTHSRPCQRGRR